MVKRGIRVVVGDYVSPPKAENSARDIEHFVTHFGFSPSEALQATRTGGEVMTAWPRARPGQAGLPLRLLLVDGDPLKDVRVPGQERFAFIMKGGVRYVPCEGAPHPAAALGPGGRRKVMTTTSPRVLKRIGRSDTPSPRLV